MVVPPENQSKNKNSLEEEENTLVDVKWGDEAITLAKSKLDWLIYKEPIPGQEYLDVEKKQKTLVPG